MVCEWHQDKALTFILYTVIKLLKWLKEILKKLFLWRNPSNNIKS